MEKNPFSIYDFFGYLFPGIFFLIVSIIFVPFQPYDDIASYFKISYLVELCDQRLGLANLSFGETSLMAILIIIIAYVLGQVISYLSSLTVEYMATRMFNYPSTFLLNSHSDKLSTVLEFYFNDNVNCFVILERGLIFLLLLPISSFILIFGWRSTGVIFFITRPLDKYVRENIKTRLVRMRKSLGLTDLDVNTKVDFHRLLMHYVYLNIPESNTKTNNYLALYGFLRAMAFGFCLLFDYLLYKFCCTINFHANFDWHAIQYMGMIYCLVVCLFLAFMKFYRRFTLENYMALLTYNPT